MRQVKERSSARGTAATLALAGGVIVIPVLLVTESTELTIFVSLYWIVAITFFAAFIRRMGLDLLSPAIAWPVILFLYLLAPALNVLTPGRLPLDFEVPRQVLYLYYACGLVGLVGFAAGTMASMQKHRWARQPIQDHSILMAKVAAVVALAVSPFAFRTDFLTIQSYAERAMDLRLERMASNTSGVYEAMVAAIATLLLATATWLLYRPRNFGIRFGAAVLIIWYVSVNTMAGWRGVVVSALCIPLAFYHYRIKRAGPMAAVTLALVIYFFMAAMSVMRTSSNPAEMVRNLSEYFLDEGLSFAQLDSMTELQVGGNLMRLITGIEENETQHTMGRSVLTELAVYVPRALYPGRPLSMSEIYMEIFYPGARQQGEGRGLFILAEGYWAFGLMGVFGFMFVYAWSLQVVYEKLIHTSRNDFGALLYGVIFYTLVVEAVRSGVLLSYKVALIRSLPFILVIALSHLARFIVPATARKRQPELMIPQRGQLPSR